MYFGKEDLEFPEEGEKNWRAYQQIVKDSNDRIKCLQQNLGTLESWKKY